MIRHFLAKQRLVDDRQRLAKFGRPGNLARKFHCTHRLSRQQNRQQLHALTSSLAKQLALENVQIKRRIVSHND